MLAGVEAEGRGRGRGCVRGDVEGARDDRPARVDLGAYAPLDELARARARRPSPSLAHASRACVSRSLESSPRYRHARAAREGKKQPARELERVVQRQHAEDAVARVEREDRGQRRDELREVLVRELDALGLSGRPAREDDAREIVLADRNLGALGALRIGARHVVEVEARQARDVVHVRVEDGDRRVGFARDVGNRVGAELGVDGNGDRARPKDAEVRDRPVGVVLAGEEHAVPGLHAEPGRDHIPPCADFFERHTENSPSASRLQRAAACP